MKTSISTCDLHDFKYVEGLNVAPFTNIFQMHLNSFMGLLSTYTKAAVLRSEIINIRMILTYEE